MEDNELTEQTEQTIKQALNYRAQKHGGSTKQQWSKIMEETNKNKRANHRNKFLAVAASVLAVAVLSSVLIAVSQSEETQSTNKGERVSTSTSTTAKPLSVEEALLKDTIVLRQVNERTGEDGQLIHDIEAVDGLTGQVDTELTSLINSKNIFNPMVKGISRGMFGLTQGVSPSCDTFTTHIFDVNKKTAAQYDGYVSQYGFSPEGEQVAYSSATCIDGVTDGDLTELNIKNLKSGKVRTLKPENFKLEAGDGSSVDQKVYVSTFNWVDENTAILGLSITGTNGIQYHLADLSKPVSFSKLVKQTPIGGGSDDFPVVTSATRIDGKVYLLMMQRVNEQDQMFARTLESENKLWSTTIEGSYGEYSFGSTPFSVYGHQGNEAFLYDGKTNKKIDIDGVAIIKK